MISVISDWVLATVRATGLVSVKLIVLSLHSSRNRQAPTPTFRQLQ